MQETEAFNELRGEQVEVKVLPSDNGINVSSSFSCFISPACKTVPYRENISHKYLSPSELPTACLRPASDDKI